MRHRRIPDSNLTQWHTERQALAMSYPFADRVAEHERLVAQGRLADPLTRRLLQQAGLARGMRVLDLGSGSGNVARLAAEFVGPRGAVVGVERDPAAVELARRDTDLGNVEFRVGDAQTLDGIEDGFDAVVGRLVLMYLADPVAALRRAATRVRSGGLICMHEGDMTYLWASPQTPLWSQVRAYFLDALEKAGVERRMGPALFTAFRAAGLPGPSLLVETLVEGGPDAPAWGWANVVSAVVPLMERLGVTTRSDVDPATLADRLLAETLACDGCVIGPLMTGAWVTLPL
jgi:SAM-dependent methyltransferase